MADLPDVTTLPYFMENGTMISLYNIYEDYTVWHFQMLSDKNKSYKMKLDKEETSKRQQLKIMRRTHEAHMQEMQNLINNLQDVVEEYENKSQPVDENILQG